MPSRLRSEAFEHLFSHGVRSVNLYRAHSQGRQTGRPAGGAGGENRADPQPQNRKVAGDPDALTPDRRSMSGSGRVSRASPRVSAVRNYTRDEGRSFGFGDQEPISSHRKLLRSKAVVVSVAEKLGHDLGRQGRERRAQANEVRVSAERSRRRNSVGLNAPEWALCGLYGFFRRRLRLGSRFWVTPLAL
jgi:hypothetical protein